MTRQARRRITGLSLAFCMIGTALSGCWDSVGADACGWMTSDVGAQTSAPHIVIMVDVSGSTRSEHPTAISPDYYAGLVPTLGDAISRKEVVSIVSFSGRRSGLRKVTEQWWHTDPHDDNPDNQEDRRKQAGTCLKEKLSLATQDQPGSDGSDPLGAIAAAAGMMRGVTGPKRIVVATDGLATDGCLNLRGQTFAGSSEIDRLVNGCVTAAEIEPERMKGTSLTMLGVGMPEPSLHPAAPSALELKWLQQLWQGLCTRAVGDTGDCDIDTTALTSGSTPPALQESAPTDPLVSFNGTINTFRLGSTYFDQDEWRLTGAGVSVVRGVVKRIRSMRYYTTVKVNGYTDSTNTAAYNRELSRKRAEAVRSVLSAEGLINVSAAGFGETGLLCLAEFVGGVPDEACLQANRRVEIVVTGA